MNLKLLFPMMGLFALSMSQAQEILRFDPCPDDFVPAGAPEWMNQLNSNANMLKMDSLYQVYLTENPDARTKANGTKPIVNFYRRWKRAYEPFMQMDGSIQLPLASTYLNQLDAQNKITRQKVRAYSKATTDTRQWSVVGPFISYHYETKEVFPDQANVYRIDIADTNSSVMYCGTETGMVYKSTDKGTKWTACSPEQNFGGNILSLKIDPKDPNHVYVGTQCSLWETKDGGDSWSHPAGWTTFKGRIDAIDIDPFNSNNLIIGCGYSGTSTSEICSGGSVYRSTDGGASFSVAISGRGMDVKYNPTKQNEVYALAKDADGHISFYKSTNNGESFVEKTMARTDIVAARMAVYNNQICALGTTNSSSIPKNHLKGKPYLFRSLDSGETWEESEGYFATDDQNGGQGYFDMTIAINHNKESEVFYGLVNPYCYDFDSKTGFTHSIKDFKTHVDIQQALFKNGELWFSTDGGINRSTDFFHEKENMYVHIDGIYSSEFWGFSQAWNEDIMVGGRFHNGNTALAPKLYGDKAICLGGSEEPTGHILMSNPRKVLFSDCNDGFILPDDVNQTVDRFPYDTKGHLPKESKHNGTDMKFHPYYAQCFLLSQGQTLYITTDDGNTINSLYTFDGDVVDYDFDRNNPNIIYVLTAYYGMYKSEDGGQSFTSMTIPTEMNNRAVSKMAINPNNSNEIWVTPRVTGSVYRSRDGGKTWSNRARGLSGYEIRSLVATGDKLNSVYALAFKYVYPPFGDESWAECTVLYYDDNLLEWTVLDKNLPAYLYMIKLYPFYADQKLRVATNNGIHELPLLVENQRPISQPMVLNVSKADPLSPKETWFESYSIAPFEGTQWDWTFVNEDGTTKMTANIRNPKITFTKDGYYDVTLKVTTTDGQVSEKTVSRMIYSKNGSTDIHTLEYNIGNVSPNLINLGDDLTVTLKSDVASAKILFYDLSGRKLDEQTLNKSSQQISTNHLSKGSLIYKIVDEHQKATIGKVVIK